MFRICLVLNSNWSTSAWRKENCHNSWTDRPLVLSPFFSLRSWIDCGGRLFSNSCEESKQSYSTKEDLQKRGSSSCGSAEGSTCKWDESGQVVLERTTCNRRYVMHMWVNLLLGSNPIALVNSTSSWISSCSNLNGDWAASRWYSSNLNGDEATST